MITGAAPFDGCRARFEYMSSIQLKSTTFLDVMQTLFKFLKNLFIIAVSPYA